MGLRDTAGSKWVKKEHTELLSKQKIFFFNERGGWDLVWPSWLCELRAQAIGTPFAKGWEGLSGQVNNLCKGPEVAKVRRDAGIQ